MIVQVEPEHMVIEVNPQSVIAHLEDDPKPCDDQRYYTRGEMDKLSRGSLTHMQHKIPFRLEKSSWQDGRGFEHALAGRCQIRTTDLLHTISRYQALHF